MSNKKFAENSAELVIRSKNRVGFEENINTIILQRHS
jgi:hypothetical protein